MYVTNNIIDFFSATKKVKLKKKLKPNFKCTECDFFHSQKKKLERHMNVHAPPVQHKCPICPFNTKVN